MRFLHTSDWHLGRTLHGVDLIDAQQAVLDQICTLVTDPVDGIAVDAVLIAGDIYDRAVPPVEAVTLFSDTLAKLTRHTTVIVAGGNHDSAVRLGFGADLFTERLQIRTALDSVGQPVLVGDVAVYPLPYLDPDAARVAFAAGDELLARSHQAVMTAAMDRVRADQATRPAGTRSIVMAHAFVVGGAVSESERSIVVGGVDSIGADTFAGVDYVALGHLHGPQQPKASAKTVLRYSGSPLRYSFSEREHLKSVTMLDLGDRVSLTAMPLRQPREMAELIGPIDQLLTDGTQVDDWVRVTITDRERPDAMFDRVRSRFPHVLQVLHVPEGTEPAGASGAGLRAPEQNPRELAADFIRYVSGLEANDAEIALFDHAYQAAVIDLAAAG
jgi:exonuclease SbcD